MTENIDDERGQTFSAQAAAVVTADEFTRDWFEGLPRNSMGWYGVPLAGETYFMPATLAAEIISLRNLTLAAEARLAESNEAQDRPLKVLAWATDTFGPVAGQTNERTMRFVEEALELVHALALPADTVAKIVRRVYSRDAGDPEREAGQAQMTLDALCAQQGINSQDEADKEFERVRTIPREHWKARHDAKVALGITGDATTQRAQSAGGEDLAAQMEGWKEPENCSDDRRRQFWLMRQAAALIRKQASALAEARRAALEEAATRCDEVRRTVKHGGTINVLKRLAERFRSLTQEPSSAG